jgi:hypothetical protein
MPRVASILLRGWGERISSRLGASATAHRASRIHARGLFRHREKVVRKWRRGRTSTNRISRLLSTSEDRSALIHGVVTQICPNRHERAICAGKHLLEQQSFIGELHSGMAQPSSACPAQSPILCISKAMLRRPWRTHRQTPGRLAPGCHPRRGTCSQWPGTQLRPGHLCP